MHCSKLRLYSITSLAGRPDPIDPDHSSARITILPKWAPFERCWKASGASLKGNTRSICGRSLCCSSPRSRSRNIARAVEVGHGHRVAANDAKCQKRTHALQQTAGCWLSIKSTRSEWRLVLCSFTLFCSHFNSLEKSNARNLG